MGRSSRSGSSPAPPRFAFDHAPERPPAGAATEPLKRRSGRGGERVVAAGAVAGPPGFFLILLSLMTHAWPATPRLWRRPASAGAAAGSVRNAALFRSASSGSSAGRASATSVWLRPGIPDCSSARASPPAGRASRIPSTGTPASEGNACSFFCALDGRRRLFDDLLGPREFRSPRRPSLVGKFAASLRGAFLPQPPDPYPTISGGMRTLGAAGRSLAPSRRHPPFAERPPFRRQSGPHPGRP